MLTTPLPLQKHVKILACVGSTKPGDAIMGLLGLPLRSQFAVTVGTNANAVLKLMTYWPTAGWPTVNPEPLRMLPLKSMEPRMMRTFSSALGAKNWPVD